MKNGLDQFDPGHNTNGIYSLSCKLKFYSIKYCFTPRLSHAG